MGGDCRLRRSGNEMPNLPHINLETAGYYAMAKIKEAFPAATGR
jgi:hypothetical protein